MLEPRLSPASLAIGCVVGAILGMTAARELAHPTRAWPVTLVNLECPPPAAPPAVIPKAEDRPGCVDSTRCAMDEICVQGRCVFADFVPLEGGPNCSTDDDCLFGEICDASYCTSVDKE
jgi:hypothetical protein